MKWFPVFLPKKGTRPVGMNCPTECVGYQRYFTDGAKLNRGAVSTDIGCG